MRLRGRNVLITGADGFIGSHLAEALVREGASVRALCLYNSFGRWGWLEGSEPAKQMDVRLGDVRDAHFCMKLVEGVELVYNLAALIPIPYSYLAPDSYIQTNVAGALNLCQAARTAGVKRFIQTSTSEVYGTAQTVPMDETHPLVPQSPYSASKIGADAIALSFYYAFGVPVVIARPFNTYGPRQSARAIIPVLISQMAAGAQEIQIGDTNPTRDFTFVSDTCEGLIQIGAMTGGDGETYHIGSNSEISMGELFGTIAGLMGKNPRLVEDPARIRPAKSEVRQLRCDYSKLNGATGFTPKVALREGLTATIEWFQQPEHLALYKTGIYNV